ncbi:hypothetical protein FMK35_29100 [Klebsiella variicola]|nr:hypothetical protein [Klebsiella variicola]
MPLFQGANATSNHHCPLPQTQLHLPATPPSPPFPPTPPTPFSLFFFLPPTPLPPPSPSPLTKTPLSHTHLRSLPTSL